MVRVRTLGLVALVSMVLVAGCTGAGGGTGGADGAPQSTGLDGDDAAGAPTAAAESTPMATGTPAAEPERQSADTGDGGDASTRAQPALVKTGTLRLQVEDHDASREDVVRRARELGGFVADSSVTRHREDDRSWKTGYVVVRVPNEEFSTMLSYARDQGTVMAERTETRDVSDQLVDIEARLENLRAQREQLREFYDRTNDTEEALAVQRRLSEVQGEIERLEARQRALQDRVAYSTLRIELEEPSPEPTPTPTPTPEPAYHETPLTQAVAASIGQIVVLGRAALVTVAYALPYLLVAGVPLALLGGIAWWRVGR